jgi:hypothetical protein
MYYEYEYLVMADLLTYLTRVVTVPFVKRKELFWMLLLDITIARQELKYCTKL